MDPRTLARGAAAAALALGGAGLAPAPASQAAPTAVQATATVRWGTSFDGTVGCSVSGDPSGYESVTLPANGGAVVRNVIRSGNVDDTGAAHRTQTVQRTKATASTRVRNGVPSSVDLLAEGRVGILGAAGNPCGASTFASADQELTFTLDRPLWMTLTSRAGRETGTALRMQDPLGDIKFRFDSYDTATESNQRWLVPPGEYHLIVGVSWFGDAAGGASTSRDGSGRIRVDFAEVGSASTRATGAGVKYAVPRPRVACATGTLPVDFTGKATRVRTATFFVNGKRVRTVRRPRPGASVSVPGLPATRPGTVRVRLVVDPPGKRRKAIVTTARSYRACAAPLNP
ncbi:hypothetical protein ABIE44_001464 [Marmoricola sp. OAE513]|uniref:hypothetical protein n=1 Tax=Marmoricola sp. OAE513 TaxID=2817894 RepID=UPI001AE530CB